MSNVTLEIAGRKYTIACAEGEEPHIEMLGASIDKKLSELDNLVGQSPERILLYASLLLADELHEAKAATPSPAPPAADAETAEKLEAMADRLETIAMQLETGASAS
ncbi:cell division protein ZapA [Aurantiacibacter sediminis]|uniref:Cell division protein ZapA n=1 Tax=Aurantiacibacter sediminis TaxID=2793064 RepID=A0ABS0N3C5_9SPHN|nr:cell division protein ZapA [Aurantiacibacter sediminis]MBH5322471.1 cell division protein ZapA [Aurantiacibacter sediminis]